MSAAAPAGSRPSRAAAETILSVNNIEVVYDRVILVLKGISLNVPRGAIVALLGANGAGKTTTLKAISNLLHSERGEVTKGSIVFDGAEVQALSPNELVRRGCTQVMEGRHCFGHLTVEENLLTGAFTRRDGKAAIRKDLDLVYSYFPKLKELMNRKAGFLSGGERQMLMIGRALLGSPKVLLIDEPTEGLAPSIVAHLRDVFKELSKKAALVIVEQNLPLVCAIAGKVYAIKEGRIVTELAGERITANICEGYL